MTPHEAFETIRTALGSGPVLVQTPRSGYATRLSCDRCRAPAECAACHGPLRILDAGRPPECGWCGTVAAGCNSGDYDVVFHWKDQATSGEVGSGLAAALAADFVKGSGIRHIDCVVHVIVVPPTESVPAPS